MVSLIILIFILGYAAITLEHSINLNKASSALVAASQGMYGLEQYPTDHYFWEFLAYCAGTGGSALIIGSAAGVAAMGMEKINFFWYVRRITVWAVLGYLAGAVVYVLQNAVFH